MYRPLIIVALCGLFAAPNPGCNRKRKRSEQQRPFQVCSRDKRCVKPQICLLRPQVASGVCVHACARDTDCTNGLRCTGRFQRGEQRQRYCRRASVEAGGDCSRVTDGCKPELACERGRICVRSCQKHADCGEDQRCVPVPDRRLFGRPSPTAYKTCLKANVKVGGTCSANQHPLCAPGLRCHRNRCVQPCDDEKKCADGRICDGRGTDTTLIDPAARAEAGFSYCRRAADLGERCSRHRARDVGCVEGLRCYRRRCRKPCATHEDCPAGKRRPLRCRQRRIRKEKVRLCL